MAARLRRSDHAARPVRRRVGSVVTGIVAVTGLALPVGVAATSSPAATVPSTAVAVAELSRTAERGGTTAGSAGSATAAGSTQRTNPSWNPHVACRATVTTLATVLGTARNAGGGATFAGGGFRPGIPNRRSNNPPCFVNGVPTFVQLNSVEIGDCNKINRDGDWSCTLRDKKVPASVPTTMKSIHIEIDWSYRKLGWGPTKPPPYRPIDIQGFVFWDPAHTAAKFHHYTGWEIHSFTAWRYPR